MIFALLTLLAALAVASVTEWFSVVGIMAIYAGAPFNAALIMGLVLGGAKLVTISWLYRNWKFSNWVIKGPLLYFTIALMIASSIGVYGFLTKSHLEQGAATVDNGAKIERLDQQIEREKAVIADDEKVMAQLDTAINSYLGSDKTDRALSVRRSQSPQRKQLKDDIAVAQKQVDVFSDEKLKLTSQVRALQLEVGPIKYIADLFFGSSNGNDSTKMEAAVRMFTLLIVSTLDPLAVILLIAANHTLLRLKNEEEQKKAAPGKNISDISLEINTKEDSGDNTSKENENSDCIINVTEITNIPELDEEIHEQNNIKDVSYDKEEANTSKISELPELVEHVLQPLDGTYDSSPFPIISAQDSGDIAGTDLETVWEIQEVKLESADISYSEISTVDNSSPHDIQPDIEQPVIIYDVAPEQIHTATKPWAAQATVLAEMLGMHPHFIPQKLNEKTKEIKLDNGPKDVTEAADNSTQASAVGEPLTREIEAMESGGQEYIPEEEVTQAIIPVAILGNKSLASAASNKYPKALSWLKEFKGV